jgi:hypothetical protein
MGFQRHRRFPSALVELPYYSPVLFCIPNKTKIVVDVSSRAYILRRKWGSLYRPAVLVRSILFIVEQNEENFLRAVVLYE